MSARSQRPPSLLFTLTGFSGLCAVALGALGAHALRESLTTRQSFDSWQTASGYHLAHSVAALGILVLGQAMPSSARLCGRIASLWLLGCLLFSGSIYSLSLGGPKWLGPVTPLGGLAFMAGWGGVVWLAWKLNPKSEPAP